MNRRDFFRKLSIGSLAAAGAPSMLLPKSDPTEAYWNGPDPETRYEPQYIHRPPMRWVLQRGQSIETGATFSNEEPAMVRAMLYQRFMSLQDLMQDYWEKFGPDDVYNSTLIVPPEWLPHYAQIWGPRYSPTNHHPLSGQTVLGHPVVGRLETDFGQLRVAISRHPESINGPHMNVLLRWTPNYPPPFPGGRW